MGVKRPGRKHLASEITATLVVADLCSKYSAGQPEPEVMTEDVSRIPSLLESRGYDKDWLKLWLNLLHCSKGQRETFTYVVVSQ